MAARANSRKAKSPGPGLSSAERPPSVSSVHSEGDCNRRTPLTNRVWEDRPSSAGSLAAVSLGVARRLGMLVGLGGSRRGTSGGWNPELSVCKGSQASAPDRIPLAPQHSSTGPFHQLPFSAFPLNLGTVSGRLLVSVGLLAFDTHTAFPATQTCSHDLLQGPELAIVLPVTRCPSSPSAWP